MKIILSGQIDHLNIKNEENIRSTRTIRIICSTITQIYKIIYL
jgi:hypothetical protein